VAILNYSIPRSIIYRDLDSVNPLSIKEINYFALKFSPSIKDQSLKDPVAIDNILLDK
jgi:hypothetical protein